MADVYHVLLSVEVKKGVNGEVIVLESFFFNSVTFAAMSRISSEFFELVEKLSKKK